MYKFLCVFRGQHVIQEREESSDEETFDIQPRLLWPHDDSPDLSPSPAHPETTTAPETIPLKEKVSVVQEPPQQDAPKDDSFCIPETPQELQGILDDLEFPHERERSKGKALSPTTPGNYTPPPYQVDPETPAADESVRDDLPLGYFSETTTPQLIPRPSRGYYTETVVTTLKDVRGDNPAGRLPEIHQFPLRNPFLDDDFSADNTKVMSQNSQEYQEALEVEEQARFQRFEDARADLGFVIRGHKFAVTPSHFEELEEDDEEDGEDGEDGTIGLLKTCEPRLLWPKRRFLSTTSCSAESSNSNRPPTDSTEEQPQTDQDETKLDLKNDDEKKSKTLAYVDNDSDPDISSDVSIMTKVDDSRFTPSPSTLPKDVFAAVALRIPSTPYFYPVIDTRASGSSGESSTYGSEFKSSSATLGNDEYFDQKKEHTITLRRHPKHRREEESEDCGYQTFAHACDCFDACWGVRQHVVGTFLWFPMERIEYEGRVDKIQVIDTAFDDEVPAPALA